MIFNITCTRKTNEKFPCLIAEHHGVHFVSCSAYSLLSVPARTCLPQCDSRMRAVCEAHAEQSAAPWMPCYTLQKCNFNAIYILVYYLFLMVKECFTARTCMLNVLHKSSLIGSGLLAEACLVWCWPERVTPLYLVIVFLLCLSYLYFATGSDFAEWVNSDHWPTRASWWHIYCNSQFRYFNWV